MTRRWIALALLAATGCATNIDGQVVHEDFSVTMSRTMCFGACPAYTVRITAHGNVTYYGSEFVRVEGKQTATVPVSRVAELAKKVERIGFFDLKPVYRANVTDNPTTYVTVTRNWKRKRVVDYVAGPRGLHELERLIDEVTGTKKWVRIDGPALQAMFESGPQPSAAAQSDFLSKAMSYGDVDVVQVLLAHGLDPNRQLGNAPLIHVARSPDMVRALKEAGADITARTNAGNALMAAADYGPELAKALLEAGVPADAPNSIGWTPLLNAACRGNADVVALLLEAGADPERRSYNNTALSCAQREARSDVPQQRALYFLYKKDYAATIRLLEAAIAKRNR